MAEASKEKSQRREKKTGKGPSEGKSKDGAAKTKDSASTVSGTDDVGHHDDLTMATENTYQLGPYKRFPVTAVTDILREVLTSHIQGEEYEVQWSQQVAKTICEVVKGRIKELMIPRFKMVVLAHVGQLAGQSMQICSRCLWDVRNDTFASYSYRTHSLYGVATVYAVYYE